MHVIMFAHYVSLAQVLPADVSEPLLGHPKRDQLLEIIIDLGRAPYARFQGSVEQLSDRLVTREDLQSASEQLGDFGLDNRAGIEGTLHRISAMKNRRGDIIGLTCRVGRAVSGHVDMIRDLLERTLLTQLNAISMWHVVMPVEPLGECLRDVRIM